MIQKLKDKYVKRTEFASRYFYCKQIMGYCHRFVPSAEIIVFLGSVIKSLTPSQTSESWKATETWINKNAIKTVKRKMDVLQNRTYHPIHFVKMRQFVCFCSSSCCFVLFFFTIEYFWQNKEMTDSCQTVACRNTRRTFKCQLNSSFEYFFNSDFSLYTLIQQFVCSFKLELFPFSDEHRLASAS